MVSGRVDAPLYRAFRLPWFADCYVEHGEIFLGRLDHYRTVEDPAARDSAEATSQYAIPLNVLGDSNSRERISFTMEVGHPVYILCASGPLVDLAFLRRTHGEHVVRIDDPMMLANEIERDLTMGGALTNRRVSWVKVAYDQGSNSDHDPLDPRELGRSYSQKDARFSSDCEYRLVYEILADARGFNPRDTLPRYQSIRLGRRLTYCDCLPNNRLKPTDPRVTPLAEGRKRRATRPAA